LLKKGNFKEEAWKIF